MFDNFIVALMMISAVFFGFQIGMSFGTYILAGDNHTKESMKHFARASIPGAVILLGALILSLT